MTVTATIAALADALYAIDPAPEEPPREGCIYTDPREAVTFADFPSIVICMAPGQTHSWGTEALGLGRHDYTLALYVFLGIRQTPLPELHARSLPWPEALMRVLANNITLGYRIDQLGNGQGPQLFTYKLGPIQWAASQDAPLGYWGITVLLPIVEKPNMEMGPGL